MYESNLEELSKEALVAMVKVYRQKEKMWKEKQLGLEPVTAQGAPIVIPSQAQFKADLQVSDTKKQSARGLNREPSSAKESKKSANKSFRMPINLSGLQTPNGNGTPLPRPVQTLASCPLFALLFSDVVAQLPLL